MALHEVAFARLADGRVTARGTANELGYRRAGGRLDADVGFATLYPEPSSGYAIFGAVQVDGRMVDAPVVQRARNLIALADAIAAKERGAENEPPATPPQPSTPLPAP